MAKTVVQKVDSPDPDVTIFRISGTLGFHEKPILAKFFDECSSRNIRKLVLDFSDLGSLGGGCAKVIREAAEGAAVRICITGASRTVQSFLGGGGDTALRFAPDVAQAVVEIRKHDLLPRDTPRERQEARTMNPAVGEPHGDSTGFAAGRWPAQSPPAATPERPATAVGYADEVMDQVDDVLGEPRRATPPRPAASSREAQTAGGAAPPGDTESGSKPVTQTRGSSDEVRELKRTLVRYRALFSLNKEFSRIEEKSRLLDAFLLTTIAEVGVESAAFLELAGDQFVPVRWKGFETADPKSLCVQCEEVDMEAWLQSSEIFALEDAPISDGARARVEKWDFPFAAPFVVHERFRGIVLLGKPIRKALDADSWEFLSMMFDQVAIAYENSCRLEQQNQRTLGLVQSLISMIENTTVSRGTTEMVMNLTYAVATKMHYPEEHIRDLLYGTVLRDIGMLSTAGLIARRPRELLQEEWDVIKQHPAEGAGMLERMGFSKHTRDIVLFHHERYNGEGYPDGLTGPQIPLGARILSVVESYAAMLHDRPNRPALTQEEALNTLVENFGLRYDPEVVKVFAQVVEDEMRNGGGAKHRGIELIKS